MTPIRFGGRSLLLFSMLLAPACAARYERATRADLREAARGLSALDETDAPVPDGTLASYVRYASAESPALRASYERWRAATLRIDPARRLPDPMVSYGFYALPVQTRVGPQRHRVSVRQDVPWPTKLTAAADAQSLRARAAQRRFSAQALALRMQVAQAWWRLWAVRESRVIQREQLEILGGLSEGMRGRVEVGQASLADLAQIDVSRSRLADAIDGLLEQERAAEAALRAAIGAPPDLPMPTTEEVAAPALPAEDRGRLAEAVREHPFLDSFALTARANEAQAESLEADRFPRLWLGLDWIETGEASMAVQGSGDDAVILNFGVTIPLWQDAYDAAQRASEADAAADRADGRAAEDAALAELEQALASLRDSYRRVHLYERTLLPQAQGAYESVVGSYAVGRGTAVASLMAQRDLLELSVGALRARAEHGAAWAQLERVVGRPVERAPVDPGVTSSPTATESGDE